jgi:serine/threonine protein kinase/tetratricopeptide (TPR) repeat protein
MIEEELFHRALEKPRLAEQLAFLDQACADQPELRERVERLLRSHRREDSFLHASVTTDQPIAERPGTVIGPYKLLQPIGEGGMGTVWMAQQTEPVKRVVALKLIKAGMDSRQVIARFEAERQALALMDHANIARVLDAGTTNTGQPYFVMGLVNGVAITRYCDEHHLTPRQRLELFIPVCQAIQHAHQKGIIHRDLKPANVLVALYDGKPVPKVIDFGVAKAAGQSLTDKTLVTGFGAIVGTLEYMSPEQAEINQLDIDTRSDIYSLGVLLYELLTGSPPFSRKELEKAGMLEMLRVIREQEPSKPSTKLSTAEGLPTLAANRSTEPAKLTKLVRGELDWIAMQALEKDRNRRYETASAFAADVERYLNDEPVQACPPSFGYRLRKFARRNKRTLLTAALLGVIVLAALGAVGGVTGWMLHQQDEQERRADEERKDRQKRADEERKERQQRAATEIKRSVDEGRRLQAQRRWPEAVAYANHAWDIVGRVEEPDALRPLVADLLKDLGMVRKLEDIALRKSDNVSYLPGLAPLKPGVPKQMPVTNFPHLAKEYGPAFRDYGIDVLTLEIETAAEKIRGRSIADYLVEALDDWMDVEADRATRNRLYRVLKAADPEGIRAQWRAALIGQDHAAMEKVLAGIKIDTVAPATLAFIGMTAFDSGLGKEGRDLLCGAYAHHPDDFWINHRLALLYSRSEPPQWDEALRHLSAALAVRSDSPVLYFVIGTVLYGQGRNEAALAAYEKAVRLKGDYVLAYINMSHILMLQGKFAEAETALRRAIEHQPKFAVPYNNLGRLLAHDPARQKEALAIYDKGVELDDRFTWAYSGRGVLRLGAGDLDKAVADFQRALQLDDQNVEAHLYLGRARAQKQQYAEAVASYQNALRIHPTSVDTHYRLGLAYAAWGRQEADKGFKTQAFAKCDKAIAEFQDTIALYKDHADAWYCLGNASRDRGHIQAAIAAFKKATVVQPNYVKAHFNLGNVYGRLGQYQKAVEAYQAALRADPDFVEAYTNMGSALLEEGAFADAEKAYGEFLARKKNDPEGIADLAAALDRQGRYAEALAMVTQACAKVAPGAEPRKRLEGLIRLYRQIVDLEGKLPAMLNGTQTPANTQEKLMLGDICLAKKLYAAAAGFYAEAFAEQPALAANPFNDNRFDAARAAACAGSGLGQDSQPTKPTDQARWRKQALAWLRADLTLLVRAADQVGPVPALEIIQVLQRWRHHVHFIGVRGAAIDSLPPDERDGWRSLWADVDALLKRIPIP